jgi:hypothetical protein
MTEQSLFDELVRAAEGLGVTVRVEPFETPAVAGGGRCLLQGEQLVLVDAHAPIRDRVTVLARALAELDSDAVFMVPEARAAVDAMKTARPGPAATL